jgi:hypothetical protein
MGIREIKYFNSKTLQNKPKFGCKYIIWQHAHKCVLEEKTQLIIKAEKILLSK